MYCRDTPSYVHTGVYNISASVNEGFAVIVRHAVVATHLESVIPPPYIIFICTQHDSGVAEIAIYEL